MSVVVSIFLLRTFSFNRNPVIIECGISGTILRRVDLVNP